MSRVWIYDTTLRDGTQGEGISLTVDDKLKIATHLDKLGVDYIEAGWPGSNPKDLEFFQRCHTLQLTHAKITAFGSTRRVGINVEDDPNLQSLIAANTDVITIYGKTWSFQVEEALRTSLESNLELIYDSVRYLKSFNREVIFDAEHFFDGYKQNQEYAISCLLEAQRAGADSIVLCDTNGGSLPHEIAAAVTDVCGKLQVPVGIHTHNDGELAVANSLVAVSAGATHIQGTINGFGERCGNANLCSILPNLMLKMGKQCLRAKEDLALLTSTAHYVSEIANVPPSRSQPFVGASAFAHKAGMHVNAIAKNPETYESISPDQVGNHRRILISELSAGDNLVYKANELGFQVDRQNPKTRKMLQEIKDLEYKGYQFESAEASLELLIYETFAPEADRFELLSFRVTSERSPMQESLAEAQVTLRINSHVFRSTATGLGPVNALDHAMRKALATEYPSVNSTHLVDYKVRVLDGSDGTAAKVRVLIETTNGVHSWTTIGVSENIIEASCEALVDSFEYFLIKFDAKHARGELAESVSV
ncbi:citramalate synthase [Fodinisporobacter ferrooxydans]|uniref:Citramalate synthase n=1 Tax=Fodinisporobacter ferrooxydans TaxID=2901836 RepID=A0ABY4CJD3_9BACL|nr:citramalate synthase [Alicyclobacillaceae bacterium MYW30-H2]